MVFLADYKSLQLELSVLPISYSRKFVLFMLAQSLVHDANIFHKFYLTKARLLITFIVKIR